MSREVTPRPKSSSTGMRSLEEEREVGPQPGFRDTKLLPGALGRYSTSCFILGYHCAPALSAVGTNCKGLVNNSIPAWRKLNQNRAHFFRGSAAEVWSTLENHTAISWAHATFKPQFCTKRVSTHLNYINFYFYQRAISPTSSTYWLLSSMTTIYFG